jgi:hypothetical protein
MDITKKYVTVTLNVPVKDIRSLIAAAYCSVPYKKAFNAFIQTDKFKKKLAHEILNTWQSMNNEYNCPAEDIVAQLFPRGMLSEFPDEKDE